MFCTFGVDADPYRIIFYMHGMLSTYGCESCDISKQACSIQTAKA